MSPSQPASPWDALRAWADAAGLLLPQDQPGAPARPQVPRSVCDNCPICQAAATLEQVNPQVLVDFAEMARAVVAGMGSALASAADQRTTRGDSLEDGADASARDREPPTSGEPSGRAGGIRPPTRGTPPDAAGVEQDEPTTG